MKSDQNILLAGLAAAGAAYYFLVYKKPGARPAGLAGGLGSGAANFAATAPKPGVPAAPAAPGLTSQLTTAGVNLATQAASGLLGALFGGGGGGRSGGGGGGGLSFGGAGSGSSRPALQSPEAGAVTTAELFGSSGNYQPVDNGIPFQTDPTVSSYDLEALDTPGQDYAAPAEPFLDVSAFDYTDDPFDPNSYE